MFKIFFDFSSFFEDIHARHTENTYMTQGKHEHNTYGSPAGHGHEEHARHTENTYMTRTTHPKHVHDTRKTHEEQRSLDKHIYLHIYIYFINYICKLFILSVVRPIFNTIFYKQLDQRGNVVTYSYDLTIILTYIRTWLTRLLLRDVVRHSSLFAEEDAFLRTPCAQQST